MAVETRGTRLPAEIFDLPVEKIREGYYTDEYFNRTRQVLLEDDRHPRVVMQVFQKKEALLAGIDEAIAVLELCSDDWEGLTVHALYEGDPIAPWETVMTIEGDYTGFAHLETVYLGVLARRTMIATNVKRGRRGRERQADHLHARPVRPPPRADGRRVRRLRGRVDDRRADRDDDRGEHLVVGRQRDRDRAAFADRVLRRKHRARGDEVRRAHGSGREHRRRSSTSRTTRSEPRSRWRARWATGSGASGSTPRARSSTSRSGTRWATSTRAASTTGSSGRCARRSTGTASSGSRSSSPAG